MRYVFLVDRSGRFNFVPASRVRPYYRRGWSKFMSVRYPSLAQYCGPGRLYAWAVRHYDC